ncbi:MAG TPA: carboxypeptidase M32 [Chitinophagaceae bacterium]|nr:carboxypeptidase M32 [Chitinophagaceae bacterium]
MDTKKRYEEYQQHLQKIADTRYAIAVLQWDQETYMPEKGARYRAQQVATLSEISHEMFTRVSFKNLLQDLLSADGLDDAQQKNIALSWYDYTQQEKLPGEFVRKLSEATSRSFQAWVSAKKAGQFGLFENDLDGLLQLKKQETDLLGYEEHPYNALLNQYERGCTVKLLDKVFTSLQAPLQALLQKITARPQVEDGFLQRSFPKDKQWEFGIALMKQLGFDFTAGRQDIAEHPFTTNFSSQDVRLTTRIDEHDFSNMTWSCIHECGHGLYEQGLPAEAYGLPLGEFTSLSIHESQSRLWENNVGRSLLAWEYFYPIAQNYFPEALQDVSLEHFYKGINKVQPSFIRTEADELTYHFHVLIRYELEKKLLEGKLAVKDIPAYWNEQYARWLGVTVPGDSKGCLQDVHWSHGSFGYFPTYSLGSFYAAQFFATAEKNLENLSNSIRNGNYKPLLEWLRTSIHQHGRRFTSEELCSRISGEGLNIDYFIQYATKKYQAIYGF